jgi:hypothetical protein
MYCVMSRRASSWLAYWRCHKGDLDAEVRISLEALNGDLHAESCEAHACPLSHHFRR